MSNMAHCRFRNTLQDLRDCQDHLDDDPNDLDPAERNAREVLIRACGHIVGNYEDDE